MSRKGLTTSLEERTEIGERWAAGQSDSQIAGALQRPLATIRKWRRRYQQMGRAGLSSPIGRPTTGALGHFPKGMVEVISQMRTEHPGWGAITLVVELGKDERFRGRPLPSRSRIAVYLKQNDLSRPYQRHQKLPEPKLQTVERPHQEWELDVQGKIRVCGLGGVSIINIEDLFSHVMVASLACLHTTHANTQDHQLILRRAFLLYGLPEQISLDHDSVFYDNQTASPFPTVLHLWLVALGVQVRFIHQPPPAEHARIERAHQTVTQQAIAGQSFPDLASLQTSLSNRIAFLNQDYPCRPLDNQPPLIAYPQAQQSQRPYRLEWEPEMLDLQRVYEYLAQGRWFRQTSSVGMFSLGAQRYNARVRCAHQFLEITFEPQTGEFICVPERGTEPFHLAAKGLTKKVLVGELDPLLSVPAYQLALPFSRQAWREILLCQDVSGTTL